MLFLSSLLMLVLTLTSFLLQFITFISDCKFFLVPLVWLISELCWFWHLFSGNCVWRLPSVQSKSWLKMFKSYYFEAFDMFFWTLFLLQWKVSPFSEIVRIRKSCNWCFWHVILDDFVAAVEGKHLLSKHKCFCAIDLLFLFGRDGWVHSQNAQILLLMFLTCCFERCLCYSYM